jgi:predicted nucleotidyltransferase
MNIRPGISADDEALALFCRRHGVVRLALFGSALGDDFRDDSDIDVLVEFAPGRAPGLLTLASMELELGGMLGREVELRTYEDLSRHFRDRVRASARELYAAA